MSKVKVRFVYPKYPDGQRELLAIFMGKSYLSSGNWVKECYARVGQHGQCHESFIRRKRATPEQYQPLLKELQSIGYIVEIV